MTTTAELIKEKKARLEMLESLFDRLNNEEDYIRTKYDWYDTNEPKLDEDGNPKTREDGSVIYKKDYTPRKMADDELDDDAKIKLTAIQTIRNQLEKMI